MIPAARVRMITPPGIGGISVVELSGPGAETFLRNAFRPAAKRKASLEPSRLLYGHIVRNGEILDEVLAVRVPSLLMPPASAGGNGARAPSPLPSPPEGGEGEEETEWGREKGVAGLRQPPAEAGGHEEGRTGLGEAEPVFEIHCHGGMVPARRVMAFLVEEGAAETGAGEVLSGRRLAALERRLAEQLIHARTTRAADVLLVQLSGRLRTELQRARTDRGLAAQLAATYAYGRRLVEPATVVITGAPNVGKSTLANALVGRERSIVHHLPGTTRDAVTSVASLDGLPVVVVDTAGLREATDLPAEALAAVGEIERIGVEKAVARAAGCDLVVWVFDHSRDVTTDEARYLSLALGERTLIPVINKMDLDGPLSASRVRELVGTDALSTCALTGRGIDVLRARIVAALVGRETPGRDAAVVTLADVAEALAKSAQAVDSDASVDYLGHILM